jgi:hypothetical protein
MRRQDRRDHLTLVEPSPPITWGPSKVEFPRLFGMAAPPLHRLTPGRPTLSGANSGANFCATVTAYFPLIAVGHFVGVRKVLAEFAVVFGRATASTDE